MAATDTTTPTDGIDIPSHEQAKLEAVIVLLRDCQDPRLAALHDKADALANPNAEVTAMRKFSGKVEELRKAEPSLTRTAAMERVRKSDPALQRELARAQNTGAGRVPAAA
jgi:hypothetical protein